MTESFQFAPSPQLLFGAGKFSALPALVSTYGSRVLMVTGARSLHRSVYYQELIDRLTDGRIQFEQTIIDREPAPSHVDGAVKKFKSFDPHVVLAIGGGSVLDAGKAISAMLVSGDPVTPYLEGVGTKTHDGRKIPFIAVPTTSGTGSEATKNAVLSEVGQNGFKRSLRHAHFVPNHAVVDPRMTLDCPSEITAASGMDAFTQLLESFVSTSANSLTDALALEGLKHISRGLLESYKNGSDLESRADMAYAAYLSGITLANAGLGVVHGFASSVGGRYSISHGVICSALMAPANEITVRKLRKTQPGCAALKKYAAVGKLFSGETGKTDEYHVDSLLNHITLLAAEMRIPRLASAGVDRDTIRMIAGATDNKYNPVPLDQDEMMEVLEAAI